MAFQRRKPEAIGTKALFPGFIAPALASPIEKVPSGTRWIHEIKFDGYRIQTHIAHDEVKIYTRRGNDWTKRFKKVAQEAWQFLRLQPSSTARPSFLRQTARPISLCCRTSCEVSRPGS
ncbi:ATP-dependent DNA ligase [Bradyrhizobium elkanii]|nr:ATP-dependent DNA ligase [Bradyrhizobium elkanii]MCS3518910.1 ATP-dependent DNA ligase [Bradyrhizobium elkanii]MCS4075468.1 ATP-dependent DNA ligase [Bradyrhizobium elkanii]MCS4082101.1 ATP-dependent DNA ligase [Bradyrhizobium elkanii]MCS4106733.1 ATP-dependent DNA ligase [Bradyrhizobium elkanii]